MTAASAALRPLLEGPSRPALVLGASPAALYLHAGGNVVAVVRRGGVALPNALLVDSPLPPPGRALVGDGLVRVGPWTASPDTWWDPKPGVCRLAGLWPGLLHDESTNPRFPWAPARLVGRGPGLTPAGDDVLAGALATLAALGHPSAGALWAATSPLLHRTTLLSAALLRHAMRGEMALPAARLLEALCGRGEVEPALRRLRVVGHTSGAALSSGILAAWELAA